MKRRRRHYGQARGGARERPNQADEPATMTLGLRATASPPSEGQADYRGRPPAVSIDESGLDLEPVEPSIPLAPWFGGKARLAKHIVPRIDAVACMTYCEPFVGMGGIFLRRTRRPRVEVVNDMNAEVVTAFRVWQNHPGELKRHLRRFLNSREMAEAELDRKPELLTDVQRAARFLFLQAVAFSGLPATAISRGSLAFGPLKTTNFRADRMCRRIDMAWQRLEGVTVERMAWQEVVAKYDRPGTLFYLDPPYQGNESSYGKGMFGRDEFAEIAEACRNINGRFLMSINDTPEIRALFGGFRIDGISARYSASWTGGRPLVTELLISGGGTT